MLSFLVNINTKINKKQRNKFRKNYHCLLLNLHIGTVDKKKTNYIQCTNQYEMVNITNVKS